MSAALEPIVQQLRAKQSPERRAASKKLRKLADPAAGPYLLDALGTELKDPRTWETQYQMIMALGECRYLEARPVVAELSHRDFEATMVYLALGDALVRLSPGQEVDVVIDLIEEARHRMLIDGALRAMAMLRLVPSESAILRIIDYAAELSVNDGNRFWIIAACPGWPAKVTEPFLAACAGTDRSDFQEALELAKLGKYKTWRPL
jgi:HEAT repeat protein